MRKVILYISLTVLLLLIGGIIWHVGYLKGLATKKSYPEDTWLAKCDKKEALIIVAHDDDAVACAGTISRLTNEGWTIREFCFYDEGNAERIKSRKEGTKRAQEIQGLKDFGWINQHLLKNPAANPPLSIPYTAFDSVYRTNDINTLIKSLIYFYKPSVVFTLDDSIGGYGHSDHVFISRAICTICRQEKNNPNFPVKKIYQPVFPADMADNILITHRLTEKSAYEDAKKIYGCNGMPAPDVQVNIADWGTVKKSVMNSYPSEKGNFNKFWQYYNWYPAWFYFKIFDREFFRVIDLQK